MDRGVYYTKHDREFVLRNKDKEKNPATAKFHSSSNKIYVISHIYIQKKIHREQCSTGGEIEGEYNKTKQGTIYIYTYITGHSQNIYYYQTTGKYIHIYIL